MSTTLFALQGKLGKTTYWITKMPAAEVVAKVRIPKEIEGWEDISIEERYQRGLNEGRVKNHKSTFQHKIKHVL